MSLDRRFWTAKEAAAYLQVSTTTLYAWCGGYKWKKVSKLVGPKPPFKKFARNVMRFPIVEFKQWADNSPRKDN